MTDLVKGAKKGNKQPRQPVIAPDSAQSKTYIKILYGLSEGEVEGLADGNKSIKLENTPLIDANGGKNFQDVKVDFRNGTNDQDYIEGFPSVDNETAVDVELTSATPWVKAFTNLDLDAIRVRLRFGPLRNQNMTNGDVTGYTIEYAFDLQTDGGPWTEVLKTKISDKTSANYERAHRIDLPSADSGWQIRVRRITPNRYAEDISDTMYVAAITEVIDVKLRYPNTSLLGLQYDAETFNNVAKVAVDLKGIKVKVPSNYNPVTRSYMGIWDGTFVRAYSNNPAWIYYDICTADRYGLGDRLTPLMIDKWSLYRLAQYCDQLVPDGLGGQEPRFTCNVYLQNAEDAFSILTKLAGVFRAISFWDGNSIICDADIPQDTYFAYSRANVIDGLFEYSGTRARDRHNVIKVAWDNPANGYKTEYEFVRDEQAIGQSGQIRILDLDAWGCTSRGQAQRAGHWALKSEQLETRTVTFKVGLDGYIPLPGRVIEISDELFAGRANGGRVSAVSTDKKTVTLDRDVTVKVGDKLVVNGENGIAQTRIVQSVVDRKVTVTVAYGEIAAQNVWVLNSQDLATMKFRVISISHDEKHQFKITALQYNSAKFDAIDNGAFIEDAPISIINPTVQDPVSNIVVSGESLVDQGINITTLVITWQQAKGAVKYLVEWRKDDGSWIKLPTTGNNSVEVQGVYAGNYQARVTAISAFEISSLPVYSAITELSGKQGLPPQLAFIRATGVLFGMQLDWGFPETGALDTAYTEIEVSPDGVSNIAQLGLFSYPTSTHTIQGLQGNLKQSYRARLIDRIGNVGAWSDWAEGTTSADPEQILEILEGHISDVIFDQDTKDKLAQIEANADAIAKETQDRANAITEEANARSEALAVEAINRANQITSAVNKEVQDRNAAIQAKANEINGTISTLNTALNQEVSDRQAAVQAETSARITAVSQLQDGLTTETNQRKSEDASLLSNIETYKTSTNNTLASVQQSITTNATNISSQATQINALDSRLTTTDSTATQALTNAATAQTTANTAVTAAQAASNQVTNLRSEISTGKGTNLLKAEYSDPVEVGVGVKQNATVQLIDSPFRVGKTYLITNNTAAINNRVDLGHITNVNQAAMAVMAGRKFLFSCILQSGAEDLGIRFYLHVLKSGGDTAQTILLKELVSQSGNFIAPVSARKVTFYSDVAITGNAVAATLRIYVGGYNGKVNPAGSVFVLDSLMVEEYFGDAREGSPYVPGPFNNNAINDSVNAVANAMSALDSKVTNIDGKVTTNANAITSLNNELNTVKSDVATKADSSALNALQSTVSQQGNTIASHGNSITTLQNNVSTINGELETKANASAVTALDNKVTSIDGRVTTNSNAVTSLNGRVTTVENTLVTKVDASVLVNYSTKTETDQAVASGIQSFNAGLSIGGANFWEFRNTGTSDYGTCTVEQVNGNLQHQKITITGVSTSMFSRLWQSIKVTEHGPIDVNSPASISFDIFPVYSKIRVYGYVWGSSNNVVNRLVEVIPNQWNRVTVENIQRRTDLTPSETYSGLFGIRYIASDNNVAASDLIGKTIEVKNLQCQLGSKATAFMKPMATVEKSILANATAINTTQAQVTDIDGRVTSQSSQVTQLQNDLTSTNSQLQLTDALTRYQGQGKLLFPDTTFKDGFNSIGVYGTSTNMYTRSRREKSPDNPSSSTHELMYTFIGNMNSGNYGFVPSSIAAAPNKVFLHKYVIKMPVGVFIQRGSNAIGTSDSGGSDRIIGNVQGTGRFETYWRLTRCGSEGPFSTTGHIAFKRYASYPVPTPENPTDIVVSQVGVWDVTDAPDSVPQSLYDSVAANASALTALDSKVTQQGNTITSQGTQLTQLQNDITQVSNVVTTKADASALTILDNKVTSIDGRVSTNTTAITNLTGRVTTVENGLATKLDASVISGYYTKVQTDSAIAGGIQQYNSSLKIGTANHAKNSTNGQIFIGYAGTSVTRTTGLSRDLLQGAINPPFRLKFTGGSQTTKTTPAISVGKLAECVLSFKIKNEGPEPITFNWNGFNHPVTGVGQAPIYLKGKSSVAVGEELEVAVHGRMRPDYEWLQFQIRVANLSYTEANVIITDIMLAEGNAQAAWTEPYQNVSDSISANATAIQNTETRVTNVEGVVTSQGSSITSINSSLDTVIDRISIKDTRDDNQPPNWYWTNHPRRVVTEFKTQAALGLSGMGTYVSLETTVPFSNATGGAIKQVAQSGDFQNYQYRYSTGSGVNAVWTEWKQYIKDIVNEMGTKASASALSALDTKVTQIDGKVDSNSTSITSLNSSLSTTNNNVTAAQNAANAANTLAGGKGKVLFQSAAPAVADRLAQNLWIDTTNNANTPKRWNGSAWAVVSDKAAIDAATAAANALAQLQTKADASAVSSLESRTTAAEGNISSLSSQTTILNNKIATAENNITANTNSISTLNNKVTVAENQIAAQSSAITKLTSEIGASTTSIKNTATSNFENDWLRINSSGEFTLSEDTSSYTGRVIQVGNNAGNDQAWLRTNAVLPFDETKLYRLRYRYKRVAGDGGFYVGIAALNYTRDVYVGKTNAESGSLSGSHYAVSNQKPTLGNWVEGEAYYKGRSTGAGTGTGTRTNPFTLANKTAFISGMSLLNYNGATGIQQIDYIIIEEVDALALGEANASALQSLDTQVSVIDGKVTTQASNITNLQTSVNGHTTSINNNTASIDGVKAVKTLTVDQNGVISGYGLVSEIINGQVTSTFGINATNFYIGAPSGGKKLLIVTTVPQTINGTQYPAGTWIDTANIASATIKNAHIQDAAITTAKIENAAITNAKIGNLSVSTLKIQDEAVTVPVGMVGTDIECGSAAFTPSNGDFDNQISEWENYLGTLITMNVNRSGGKAMLNAALTFVDSGGMIAIRGNYNALGGTERFNMRMVLSIYANGNLIGRANVSPVHTMGDTGVVFAGGLSIVSAIDLSNSIGNVTYTLKFGFGYVGTQSGKIILNGGAPRTIFKLTDIRMTLIEMKK
ncbi:phage tail protein [Acinetobacter haemolyticus]|uniref:TipJ family phage tail tip protein n=1 Tax=Acinetobacter haemolyticus TaxID=29430 RepID=UPI001372AE69|nr:phage tail protein [Acinetobacter haemolyticus]NAS06223.1 phage tail protein [Acinetobacter haemolyticus]